MTRDLTDDQIDTIADAHRWDTREGRRALVRAALASAPAADLTDDQIDACVGNLGMAPYSVLAGPDEIRKFARKLLAERAFHPQAQRSDTVYVECRECRECGHVGLNDSSPDATCILCDYSGPSPAEDVCPQCAEPGAMGAACPKCGGRYALLTDGNFPPSEQAD